MALFRSIGAKIAKGLSRTREAFSASLRSFLIGRDLDDDLIEELHARLLRADVGVDAARDLVAGVRTGYKAGELKRGEDVLEHLKSELKELWPQAAQGDPVAFAASGPTVIFVAGVNGAGKTTSVAKLANRFRSQGKSVLLAACDTFRAGAVRQLEVWSERLDVSIVRGQQGGDPAAVAFDACAAAVARSIDVLIVDTAGRLQTQDPLMRELAKVRRVVEKQIPEAPHETLLVLDATSGQNALRQAEAFTDAVQLTGLVLAKLDGTAKGGAAIAIRRQTDIPVKFVGVGESLDDLEVFDPGAFVEALFAASSEE